MGTLLTGSGVARLVGLITTPLLTRLYTPSDYGILSVFTAAVAIMAPVINLRFAQAIPLPRSDRLAARIAAASLASSLILASTFAAGLWLTSAHIFAWLSIPSLVQWWWLIAIGSLIISTYETLAMWATRKRAYRIIAKTTVTQTLLGETIKLTFGFAGIKPLGLLLGQLANQGAGLTTLLLSFKGDLIRRRRDISTKAILRTINLYRSYPTLRLASHILLVMSMQAPVVLSAKFFSASEAGQLGLALMTLAVPVALIGDNMARAFFAEISQMGARRSVEIRSLTLALVKRLFIVSIPCSAAFVLMGPWIFTTIFGEQWNLAGRLASLLSIYLAAQFIQKPVSYILYVFDAQAKLLLLNLQRFALTAGCFCTAALLDINVVNTIAIYSLALAAHYVFSIFVAIRLIPDSR